MLFNFSVSVPLKMALYNEFYDISTEIVASTSRLPLAIEVIGSSLCNQDYEIWTFILEKLKEAPHENVQKILMISYQALQYEQQQIFLDIACFFNNEEKIDPIYFWEACKFYPDSGIEILIRRSLIKVDHHEKLWMHDQLKDLGRAIAQPKCQSLKSQMPSEPTRLWSPEVALAVLQKKEVNFCHNCSFAHSFVLESSLFLTDKCIY